MENEYDNKGKTEENGTEIQLYCGWQLAAASTTIHRYLPVVDRLLRIHTHTAERLGERESVPTRNSVACADVCLRVFVCFVHGGVFNSIIKIGIQK